MRLTDATRRPPPTREKAQDWKVRDEIVKTTVTLGELQSIDTSFAQTGNVAFFSSDYIFRIFVLPTLVNNGV